MRASSLCWMVTAGILRSRSRVVLPTCTEEQNASCSYTTARVLGKSQQSRLHPKTRDERKGLFSPSYIPTVLGSTGTLPGMISLSNLSPGGHKSCFILCTGMAPGQPGPGCAGGCGNSALGAFSQPGMRRNALGAAPCGVWGSLQPRVLPHGAWAENQQEKQKEKKTGFVFH